MNIDAAFTTVFGSPAGTGRPSPGENCAESELSEADRLLAERLMRVNHAGEVAAQALYQGQALTARLDSVRAAMEKASQEENDHLAWCTRRLRELSGLTAPFDLSAEVSHKSDEVLVDHLCSIEVETVLSHTRDILAAQRIE